MARATTRLLSAGSFAALLVTAGCAHHLVAPDFGKSVSAGRTVLLFPAQVTVRKGALAEADEGASAEASAHVANALQRYLEEKRGLRVVRLGATSEETRLAGELHLRVAAVLPKLRQHFAEVGQMLRMAGEIPEGITIHSIEKELAAAGANALVVVEGSDHVSDSVEVLAHVLFNRPA